LLVEVKTQLSKSTLTLICSQERRFLSAAPRILPHPREGSQQKAGSQLMLKLIPTHMIGLLEDN